MDSSQPNRFVWNVIRTLRIISVSGDKSTSHTALVVLNTATDFLWRVHVKRILLDEPSKIWWIFHVVKRMCAKVTIAKYFLIIPPLIYSPQLRPPLPPQLDVSRGLTFTWWGCYGLCLWHNQASLPTPFYSFLVSISVFMSLSTVFHSISSP